MITIGLYAVLAAACFYLGSRAKITEAIWSLYPTSVARFMDCPACTGFWWGVIWAATLGRWHDLDAGLLKADESATPILVGLIMVVLVPIVTGLHQWGLERTGSAIEDGGPQE